MQVTVEEAKTILPELCELTRTGLDVIITKDGQPYIRLLACNTGSPAADKKVPIRAKLRDTLPLDAFKLLPGWDEPLASILESETEQCDR